MTTGYFFDLDGTLYSNRTHSVSNHTIEALSKLQKQGNKVFLATSRTLRELDHLPQAMRDFPFDARIMDGGSRIMDADQNDLRCVFLLPETMRAIDAFCKENHLIYRYSTCSENLWGTKPNLYAHRAYFDLYLCAPFYKPYQKDKVLNVLVFIKAEDQKKLRPLLKDCGIVHFDHAMEIRANHVDKIEAIQWCKERFDLDTLICFGDGQNDIEMIRQADLGICMQNGHPNLKKVADLVIGDVSEDGIYQFLKESHRI